MSISSAVINVTRMQTGNSSHKAAPYCTCLSQGRSHSQTAPPAPPCRWRACTAKPRSSVCRALQSIRQQQARRLCRHAYTRSDREASIQDLAPILDSVQHVAKPRTEQQAARAFTSPVSSDSLFPQSHVRPDGILGYLTFLCYFPFGKADAWRTHVQPEHVLAWVMSEPRQMKQQYGMYHFIFNLTWGWACRLGFVTFPHVPLGDVVGCGSSLADCQ